MKIIVKTVMGKNIDRRIGRTVVGNGRTTEAEGEYVSGQMFQVQTLCKDRSTYDES